MLGGTFNPPHVGHLLMASEAAEQLGLDEVVLMVAAVPPHKVVDGDPGPEVRLELVQAAVEPDPRLSAGDLELRREGPSWTVSTLRELHAATPEDELTFIVGGDQALGLPSWREPAAVLELARLAVAEREQVRRRDVLDVLTTSFGPAVAGRIDFFDMPRVDVSSTLVRRRASAGRSVRYLVPDAVAEHIHARGLYREPERAGSTSPAGGTQHP